MVLWDCSFLHLVAVYQSSQTLFGSSSQNLGYVHHSIWFAQMRRRHYEKRNSNWTHIHTHTKLVWFHLFGRRQRQTLYTKTTNFFCRKPKCVCSAVVCCYCFYWVRTKTKNEINAFDGVLTSEWVNWLCCYTLWQQFVKNIVQIR